MAGWYVMAAGSGEDPSGLVGKLLLVELSDGKDRALGFIKGSFYTPPSTSPYGLPLPAKVTATVQSYVPLTKGAVIPLGTQVEVFAGQALSIMPADTKTRLRFIDRRGVPWSIEGYQTPPEGFDKRVVGWTSHYAGSDGVSVEGDTFDEVRAEIKKVESAQFRNPPPALDASTALRDDQGPIVVKDDDGDFAVHGVTSPEGKYTFWAARLGGFQNDVVGPASSLAQITADVAAYRSDTPRGAALGLDAWGQPVAVTSPYARFSQAEETATTAASQPQAETVSSLRWQTLLAYGAAGLLIWAAVKYDRARGL